MAWRLSQEAHHIWHHGCAGEGSVAAASPGEGVHGGVVQECAAAKGHLLWRVQGLLLPPNFLDHLIEELSGKHVCCPMKLLWLGPLW